MDSKIVPGEPALVLEGDRRYLIVTDLHIGFESTFRSKDIHIGKNTTTVETIKRLKTIIKNTGCDVLVLLGDVKSSIGSITKGEWEEVPTFFEEICKSSEVILIPGNHDANINRMTPTEVTLIGSTGMIIEDILLTHGHVLPSDNYSSANKIVMGHIHPVFFEENSLINGQRVWVSIRTQKEYLFPNRRGTLDITIVPSFNKYFYASHKSSYRKSISPIIKKIKSVSSARILTLDGAIIGDESILERVI